MVMEDGIPKYVMVRDHLRVRIEHMKEGAQLPSEGELCSQFNVSRITIRRAVEDLIHEGLIVRHQGRGTFKTENSRSGGEVISGHIRGFYRQQSDLGRVVRTQVLDNRIIHDPEVADSLGISETTGIVRLERLRYVNDILQQHVVTFLSAQRFPLVANHDFSQGSLYEFIETNYSVKLTENQVLVRVQAADEAIADYFDVQEGAPLLAMDSTVCDQFDAIVAYGVALNVPEHSEIKFIVNSHNDV